MRTFIVKITLFICTVIFIFITLIGALYLKSPKEVSSYFYGKYSKQRPKIVLVGSSNVYINYDYDVLNDYFINYDFIGVNMAASVGFIPVISKLNQLELNPDDIIIFCMPYQLYDPDFFINFYDDLPQKALSRSTILNAFKYNPKQTLKNFLAFKPKSYFSFVTDKKPTQVKADSLLKINTNQVNLLKIENYISCKKEEANFDINSMLFDKMYLTHFMAAIKTNIKSQVYFRFPSVHKGRSTVNTNKIDFMSSKYNFINDYNTSVYDSTYWYNGRYHLNKCGAIKNTDLLINEINTVLSH